jgi:hypothetical protein
MGDHFPKEVITGTEPLRSVFSIYPNPIRGKMQIEGASTRQQVQMTVTDISGRALIREKRQVDGAHRAGRFQTSGRRLCASGRIRTTAGYHPFYRQSVRTITLFALILLSSVWLSCGDSPAPTPPVTGGNEAPELSGFSPLSGKKGTIVKIQGKHFGSDVSKVSLQINGLKATINAVTDTEITAIVPDKCGLGKLVVNVNGREVTSGAAFRYLYTAVTSYFSGNGKGMMEATAAIRMAHRSNRHSGHCITS